MAIQGITPVTQAWRYKGFPAPLPYQGRRATISPDIFKGGKPNPAGAGTLASRQIIDPKFVGPLAEDGSGPMINETQQVIANQTSAPTFRLGNEANGRIDLGDLVSSRANPTFDSSKAIGGSNVPMKPTSGIGGLFRSFFGDKANEQNLAAQQAQGQQWAENAKEDRAEASAVAREDRLFGRQKELRGLDSADTDKREAARQAREDAQIATNEANRAAELMAAEVQRKLDAEVATDKFNRTLEANRAAMPPKGYKLDEVYPNDDGSFLNFRRDPMTGNITKAGVTDKPAFTPPPKGSIPEGPAKAPLALGEEVQGIAPEIPDMLRKLGSGISAQTAAPRQIVNDVGANLFGGRVVENPTALTRAVAHPIEGLSNFILSQQGLAPSQISAGSPAIPSKLPEQTTEDYIKMLRKLKGGY